MKPTGGARCVRPRTLAFVRDFRDFIRDRVKLPCDEFNRVPVAGVMTIARLMQMLDDAAIAFLIMTAEDELLRPKLTSSFVMQKRS